MDTYGEKQFAGLDDQNAEVRDINERLLIGAVRLQELADIALRSEQFIRDLVHGLDVVICEVGVKYRQLSFLSVPSERFLGHSSDYWRTKHNFLTAIVHENDKARVADLLSSFDQIGRTYEYEFLAQTVTKDRIWLRNIVHLVHDAAKNIELLRCVIVDVTAQKRTAKALEDAYHRERHIAETLQRSILFMPSENSFPGLAINRRYAPASDEASVGGDFWDAFAFADDHVALVLGDVMGHGLPAAMFTAELKYALRAFVLEHKQPGRILTQMNKYLCECYRLFRAGLNTEGNDSPLCLTVVVVDASTGQGCVASAGMEPPLLVRSNGEVEELIVGGLLLGITPGETYDDVLFRLEANDSLVMVTDGVTETRQGRSFLGYEGLTKLAKRGWSLGSLQEMGRAIIDGTKAFGGGTLSDDACVLIAQRH